MQAKSDEALELLDNNHIPYEIFRHEAAWNMGDRERLGLPGDHLPYLAKNLLLAARHSARFFLYVTTADAKIRWSPLARQLGVSRSSLGFATPEDMARLLGVTPGTATPLALMHDTEGRVEVLLDRRLARLARIGMHPNTNTATVFVAYQDLLRILTLLDHEPTFIDSNEARHTSAPHESTLHAGAAE